MRVAKEKQQSGKAHYYLRNDDGEIVCCYGTEPPTFQWPTFPAEPTTCESYLSTENGVQIEDGEVDLIIDDPPYGTTQATWDKEPQWAEVADMYHRVLADDGTLVVFGKQPSLIPVYNVFTDHGFDFRFELIWKKRNNPWVSNSMPIPIHENIFVFCKSTAKATELSFDTDAIERRAELWCPNCEQTKSRGSYSVKRTHGAANTLGDGWEDVYESESSNMRFPVSYLDEFVLDATALPSYDRLDQYVEKSENKSPAEILRYMADLIEETERDVLEFTSVGGSHEEYMG